jgi:hypothetical protein
VAAANTIDAKRIGDARIHGGTRASQRCSRCGATRFGTRQANARSAKSSENQEMTDRDERHGPNECEGE